MGTGQYWAETLDVERGRGPWTPKVGGLLAAQKYSSVQTQAGIRTTLVLVDDRSQIARGKDRLEVSD
jgi:hypothetical protein